MKSVTHTARRMDTLAPHFFATLSAKVAALQAAGRDVIRLDEGSPDLPPASHIIDALARSAASPLKHGYQPHRGPRILREAWVEMYRRVHQVDLDPEHELVLLLGSKEGIFHTALALVEPGDVVLVPDPGYITYSRGAQFAGAEVCALPLLPTNDYLPDLDAIPPETAQRARLLWLNYPNNPTAATASLEFFTKAVEFARRHNLLLCHDAAYAQVTFTEKPAPSLLQVPGAAEVAVEFNTLSKSHNMAGWRTGAAVGNPHALQALYTLKTNADSGHFLPVMEAAAAAMTGDQDWTQARNLIYRERRDIVVSALHRVGLPARTPLASLYVWSPVPPGCSAQDFTTALLEHALVSLTPGTVFGRGGEGFVRISLTAPTERVAEAMQRLEQFMGSSSHHA